MTAPILPGAAIGILGGGQLGRMTALAAGAMGYRVHVLDPDPACAAAPVVERVIPAAFDDADAAAELARGVSVVTLEIEKIAPAALAAAERHAPVRPGAAVLHVVQDRVRQKRWLVAGGFPVGPFREATDEAGFVAAVEAFAGSAFAKSNFGGYDGRGQAELADAAAARTAWQALGAAPCIVEEALALEGELSVLVARAPDGTAIAYPPARNHHENRILSTARLPGDFDPPLIERATELALAIARALEVTGLVCVEMFLAKDGRLLVNELAPRPHNSYHGSDVACPTGQFEQLVRAVCGLPLGAVEPARPTVMRNLLGDLWTDAREPAWERVLAVAGVRLVLYGKGTPRPARKMGHLVALGETGEDALERATRAYTRLLA